MNMPKLTKKDKRTNAEIKMDNLINKFADDAKTAEDAVKVLDLMKKREEVEKAKKPKIDPAIVNNIITGAVGLVQIFSIINAEELKILSKSALSFVHKGRLR